MTTSEMIRLLQQADPSGKLQVLVAAGEYRRPVLVHACTVPEDARMRRGEAVVVLLG